jgi:hypothetical protein
MVTHREIIDRTARTRARTHVIRLKYRKVSLCVIALPPAITRARPDPALLIRRAGVTSVATRVAGVARRCKRDSTVSHAGPVEGRL